MRKDSLYSIGLVEEENEMYVWVGNREASNELTKNEEDLI